MIINKQSALSIQHSAPEHFREPEVRSEQMQLSGFTAKDAKDAKEAKEEKEEKEEKVGLNIGINVSAAVMYLPL